MQGRQSNVEDSTGKERRPFLIPDQSILILPGPNHL